MRISPSKLHGTIAIPPSKSHTLRAILFAALAEGTSRIHNLLPSPDADVMTKACQQLGAVIVGSEVTGIRGKINGAQGIIDAGNSGITLRFLTAIGALSPTPIQITGDTSLCQRPMQPLLTSLNQLGAKATSKNGFAPVTIHGPFQGGVTTVLGEDSQFVSALLIAGALSGRPLEIHVQNPGEKPWIDLTLHWLKRLNIAVENREYCHYRVMGQKAFPTFNYEVPGDFSSAAFPLIAALATGSELTISNLDFDDCQGDKAVIPLLQKMGAHLIVKRDHLIVKNGKLKGISIDVNPCIDALPALATIACFAEGETVLYNAKVARTKECDRLHAITKELRKMGASIDEEEDSLRIRPSRLHGATLSSHGDHRIGMALACAALAAEGDSLIEGSACIAKTFPDFVEKMQQLGATVKRNS